MLFNISEINSTTLRDIKQSRTNILNFFASSNGALDKLDSPENWGRSYNANYMKKITDWFTNNELAQPTVEELLETQKRCFLGIYSTEQGWGKGSDEAQFLDLMESEERHMLRYVDGLETKLSIQNPKFINFYNRSQVLLKD